jgi:hypothetical protein
VGVRGVENVLRRQVHSIPTSRSALGSIFEGTLKMKKRLAETPDQAAMAVFYDR